MEFRSVLFSGYLCISLTCAIFLPTVDIKSKRQAVISKSVPFPCPLGNDAPGSRSQVAPASVHELRPGDIDVIGGIGDSLMAATGALASTLVDFLAVNNRGMSWVLGGQGSWREYLTLPNILKLYNSNLTGYSIGNGYARDKNAQFNVAVSGAMDQDLYFEAVELVRRMRNDQRVDMKNHWKLIAVWIGTNDICLDYCFDSTQGATAHKQNLQKALDYLYKHVPRAYVMLISTPYVPYYAKIKDKPEICLTTQTMQCPCLINYSTSLVPGYGTDRLRNASLLSRSFQLAEKQLAESDRYGGRDDFTVEFQPTFQDSQFPLRSRSDGSKTTDYTYLSIDCIHYSQKLHAVAANSIWNNLLEPPWDKTTIFRPMFERFLCPSEKRPYLLTRRNTKDWRMGRD